MVSHAQQNQDEAFFVLEGLYSALIDDERVELGPGSYLFVPRGIIHAITNIGLTLAWLLIMIMLGGNHERFLTEIGELVEDPARYTPGLPVSDTQIALAVAKYGVEFFADLECLNAV